MHLPAIVIPVYNRAYSLQRLLQSVSKAVYNEQGITLVISVDKNDNEGVYRAAENFEWLYGEKIIVKHEAHLGLKQHILRCGDLTETYGSVIILEDDLFVSPWFYQYTIQALSFYGQTDNQKSVAGISLFNYEVAENGFGAFEPMPDGSDVYFMQMPSSWGQCWTAQQWNAFKEWFSNHSKILSTENLPEYILGWSETSWKKHFVRYLIATNQYFVFPRFSLSTNFGEPGTNTDRRGLFQSALFAGEKTFLFKPIEQSLSVYDAWFEMKTDCFQKLLPDFSTNVVELDLYGTKRLKDVGSPFVLSSKPCKKPVKSFGNELRPMLLNVTESNSGTVFCLGAKDDFEEAEVDMEIFYPVVSSVADIVFYQKIKALSEERIQKQLEESRYRNRYKEIAVVVLGAQAGDYRQTLKSIAGQNYPHLQLVFVSEGKSVELDGFKEFRQPLFVEGRKDLLKLLRKMTSSVFVIANPGDVFLPGAFRSANEIFSKFEFIHLLSGLTDVKGVTENLPTKRINKDIFLQNVYRKNNCFNCSSFFFDHYALQNAMESEKEQEVKTTDDLFYQLICTDAFYTTPDVFSKVSEVAKIVLSNAPKPDWSFGDSIAHYFFEKDTVYLRYFFAHSQKLPPVVRYELEKETWYLSEY